MKTTLIIAPAFITVQADVRNLPKGNEEMDVISMQEVPSGYGLLCARIFQAFRFPYIPASVIGTNVYGDRLLEYGEKQGILFTYTSEEDMGSVLEFRDPEGNTVRMRVPGCELDVDYDSLAEEDIDEIGRIVLSADMLNGETADDLLEYLFRTEKPASVWMNDSIGNMNDDLVSDLLERKPLIITEERYLKELTGIGDDLKEAMEVLQKQTQEDVIVISDGTGVFVQSGSARTLAEETRHIDAELFAALFAAAGAAGLSVRAGTAFALKLAAERYTRKHLDQGRWDFEKQKLKESILEN